MKSPAEPTFASRPTGGVPPPSVFDVIDRHMSRGLALAYRLAGREAVEVSAEGARVRLSNGRDLIDFGSYAVCLLGHRHPAVVDAVGEISLVSTVPRRSTASSTTDSWPVKRSISSSVSPMRARSAT